MSARFQFTRLKQEWHKNPTETFFMDFHYNKIDLTVIYSKAENSLLLLKKGANRVEGELELPLMQDFAINTYLDSFYQKLVRFLEIQYDPQNRFKPFNFFKSFDDNFRLRRHADEREVSCLNRFHHLEDPDAIYYQRLISHDGKNSGNVTSKNLEKTKWLLPVLYEKIKGKNISVGYTADKHKSQSIPPEYQ